MPRNNERCVGRQWGLSVRPDGNCAAQFIDWGRIPFILSLPGLGIAAWSFFMGIGLPYHKPEQAYGAPCAVFDALEPRILLSALIGSEASVEWELESPGISAATAPIGDSAGCWLDFDPGDGLGPGAEARVDILTSTDHEITGRVTIPGLWYSIIDIEADRYTVLEMPGSGFSGATGQAQLPQLRTFLQIPSGVDVQWSLTDESAILLEIEAELLPVQPPSIESSDEAPQFAYDADFYRGLSQGVGAYDLSGPMVVRGLDIVCAEITPFEYDPVSGELAVITQLSFAISFEGEIEAAQAAEADRLRSPFYESLLDEFVSNYDPTPAGLSESYNELSAGGADYLIITADAFYDEVLPLAEWKNLKGVRTELLLLSEVGATADDIAAYIQQAYDEWAIAPSYVLLVGDYDDVPSNPIGDYLSDIPYACVDNADGHPDYFPDLTIGRLPVHTAAEASIVVGKILEYDRYCDPGQWYDDALVAAYFQGPNDTATRWFMEGAVTVYQYLRDVQQMDVHAAFTPQNINYDQYYYAEGSYPHRLAVAGLPPYEMPTWASDMFVGHNQAAAQVIDAINNGVGLVQHRDHGLEHAWGDPPLNTDDVYALTNGDMTPVVFSINCLTGRFNYDGGDSLAEAFLKNPNGGAVGVIAATQLSWSGYNDLLTQGLYTAMWPDFDPSHTGNAYPASMRPAEALNFAKFYLYMYEGDNRWTEFESYEFHWFGDPEMMLRTQSPAVLSVTHDAEVRAGAVTDVTVRVSSGSLPVAGARVCISDSDGDEFWVCVSSADGIFKFGELTTNNIVQYNVVVSAH